MFQYVAIANTTNLYHGTSQKSKESIIISRKFYLSENEWAGSGIYFFIDKNDDEEKENARRWAVEIKNINDDEVAIIIVNLDADQINMFDLTDREVQNNFHKYREETYKRIISDKLGDRVISNTYKNEMRLDCYIINKMCEYFNYNVVVRDAYIKFSKGELGFKYPKSSIPNCTIMCVRDNKVIANMK